MPLNDGDFFAGGFATRAIHAGQEPDPATGSVVVPIYQTSTYAQDVVGQTRGGYDYSRAGNPTRTALEVALASLEEGKYGSAYASGMAATDTLLRAVLRPGDHVILPDDAYGGTWRLLDKIGVPWGLTYTATALGDLDGVRDGHSSDDPDDLVRDADEPAAAHRRHRRPRRDRRALRGDAGGGQHLRLAIPAAAHPARRGRRAALDDQVPRRSLRRHRRRAGHASTTTWASSSPSTPRRWAPIAGPFDCWLALRGVRTLALRMEKHCDNAERVAEMLVGHPRVSRVYYPGLADHPNHDVAARQMKRFGGMVSFTLAGGVEEALKVCQRTRVFTLGESLGGVESLIEHPGLMTHASVAGSQLQVADDLIRLSVGIEDIDDLLADLRDALD